MSQILETKEDERLRLHREYMREWRSRNPDYGKDKRSRQLHRERVNRYNLRHPDRIKEKSKRDYQRLKQDPEQYKEYVRLRFEDKEKRRENDLAYRIGYGQYNVPDKRKAVPIEICRALIERENGLCQYRDESSCKGSLSLHHIDGNPENNELSNLMLLCRSHHKSISH